MWDEAVPSQSLGILGEGQTAPVPPKASLVCWEFIYHSLGKEHPLRIIHIVPQSSYLTCLFFFPKADEINEK